MSLSEYLQYLSNSECISSSVVVQVERVIHYDWVLSDFEYLVERTTIQLSHLGIEIVAEIVQELSQVLSHRVCVLLMQES
jgi:hypothetical protein